jgi:hypothetical protein
MEYNFSFVLRSDDYYPVYQRVGRVQETIQEILLLDDSSFFRTINVDAEPEGTGNFVHVNSVIESETPGQWLTSAQRYVNLRDMDIEVTMTEVKEPEVQELPIEESPEVVDIPSGGERKVVNESVDDFDEEEQLEVVEN